MPSKNKIAFNDSMVDLATSPTQRSLSTTARTLETVDITGKSISVARMPMTMRESAIAQELSKKEENCSLKFDNFHTSYTKNRNPIMGQSTPRKDGSDAELLIPIKATMKLDMAKLKFEKDYAARITLEHDLDAGDNEVKYRKTYKKDLELSDMQRTATIGRNKNTIDNELAELKKVMAYHQKRLSNTNTSAVSATSMISGGVASQILRSSSHKRENR